jgi:hypothetical protein
MRARTKAAWAGSALAVALFAVTSASAEPKQVNVSECVKYSQHQDDGGMDFGLKSSCAADLECSISWMLRCDGDAADQKRQEARAFMLPSGQTGSAYASADACGEKGWSITRVRWSCKGTE